MFKEISFAAPTLLSQVSGDRKHTFLMLKVIAARPIPIALYCCLWPMIPWHLYDGSINPHQYGQPRSSALSTPLNLTGYRHSSKVVRAGFHQDQPGIRQKLGT